MNYKISTELTDIFKVGLAGNYTRKQIEKVNTLAMRLGYVVHPRACSTEVYHWLKTLTADYNSTFYKTWTDITSKNRWELLIDQLMHYASTYGTGFTGEAWTPNKDHDMIPYKEYKFIDPIEEEDLFERCNDFIKKDIAFKEETLTALINFIHSYVNVNHNLGDIVIDDIKNREAQIRMCDAFNLRPCDKFSLLRYIIYKITGATLMIKDAPTIECVKCCAKKFDLSTLNEDELVKLSSIFHRFKPLFLAMKTYEPNKSVVNKLRKMANKYHEPFHAGFWETLINHPSGEKLDEMKRRMGDLGTFKIINLIQTLNEALLIHNDPVTCMFPIRNGKVYMKHFDDGRYRYDLNKGENFGFYWNLMKAYLMEEVARRVALKLGDKVAYTINDGLKIACPTSEKNFVGNMPFGTSYKLTDHNYFGVYWKDEWGANDLDLSYMPFMGGKIGWNQDFYTEDRSIVHSGDMTSANPYATEILYAQKGCPDGEIRLNVFSGLEDSKYRFFVGRHDFGKKPQRNCMVDPNDITLDIMTQNVTREQLIGVVVEDTFYLMSMGCGYNMVSRTSTGDLKDIMKRKGESFVNLVDILNKAGINEWDGKDETVEVLDLNNLTKDRLLEIFA